MEDRGPGSGRFGQAADEVALARGLGVIRRGQDHGHRRVPGRRQHPAHQSKPGSGSGEVAQRGAKEQRPERHGEPGQQGLDLRVAEAGVALDQDRTLRSEHQSGIQRATERRPAAGELRQDRHVDHVDERGAEALRHIRHGAVGAHAAGIGAQVVVEQPLVVACRGQGQRAVVVTQGDQAGFCTDEALLEHYYRRAAICGPRLGLARTGEELAQRLLRTCEIVADGHSLTSHQPVRLDHHPSRPRRGGQLAGKRQRRPEGPEGLAARHADTGRRSHVAAERLAPFDPGRGADRPECGQAGFLQDVDDAGGERRLRPDHDQIHVFGGGQGQHRGWVRGGDPRHAPDLGLFADGVAPRRHYYSLHAGFAGQAPDQGVLASAAAEYQHPSGAGGHGIGAGLQAHRPAVVRGRRGRALRSIVWRRSGPTETSAIVAPESRSTAST